MKKFRTLVLSVLILGMLAGGLPITDTLARWARRSSLSYRHHHRRHHSRAWWRRHRAHVRAMRERAMLRGNNQPSEVAADTFVSVNTSPVPSRVGFVPASARAEQLPFGLVAPHSWSGARVSPSGEVMFVVNTSDGRPAGTAVLSPLSVPAFDPATLMASRAKSVGGRPVAALRRKVIDRMVAEGGWVVNDTLREMQGHTVFVVYAQKGTPSSPNKSMTFYFTELDGRIYSLATTSPIEFTEPVASGSEQVMATLHASASRNIATQK